MLKRIFAVTVLILIYSISYTQIVNIEKKRKEKNGFQATVGFNFNIKESSSRILELKNIIDLQYSLNSHTFILLNDIKLLSVDNGSLINNGFQHLRYNCTIKDSSFITLEAFGQHQYNEQKLLQKRVLGGVGPRFRIINKEKIKWYFAPLVMYEYEQLSDSLITETKLIRWDAYTNFHFSLSNVLSFNLITYFQPAFSNFNDFRISGEAGIRFKINKYLSYNVSYSADYDNLPPNGIQNTFWYFKNKLIFKL